MGLKISLYAVAILLMFALITEARHTSSTLRRVQSQVKDTDYDESDDKGSVFDDASEIRRGFAHGQGRVFPGAVAIKKLVLLKFKKIVPISLILLKSNNENEAELVPVYPTSEIPANVQFIPTPNGISGHKDVQAIAIPSELHEQLEASGLANIENIEALLQEASEVPSNEESTVSVVESTPLDQPLKVNDADLSQVLEVAAVPAMEESKPAKPAVAATTVRRIAPEDISRPIHSGLKTSQRTAIEEIPIFLYSAKDAPALHKNAHLSGLHLANISNTPVRRRIHS